MQPPKTTTSEHYPEFIQKSKELKKLKKRDSIFPAIGLKNYKKKDGNLTVVFSATGNRALWDLATMSMRGVSSCQSWSGFTVHCKRLIGSMADPCCGIIYTTDGRNTKRGPLMIHRAIVRFVVSGSRKKKPAILLERVYGSSYNAGTAAKMFEDYIREKTGNKFPIVSAYHGSLRGHTIPMTKPVKSIHNSERSYVDSGVRYSAGKKIYTMKKLEELV